MTYSFTIDETDYLTHQLFIASTSKTTNANRRRSWALITVTFLLLAWLFHNSLNESLRNYFLVVAGICLIFYPFYSRWRYKKHYRKHVRLNHANSFGQTVYIEFLEGHILTKDDEDSESKINLSYVVSLNELPEHFLIQIKGGQSLILPKQKIGHVEKLRTDLVELAKKVGLQLTDHTQWKWK